MQGIMSLTVRVCLPSTHKILQKLQHIHIQVIDILSVTKSCHADNEV